MLDAIARIAYGDVYDDRYFSPPGDERAEAEKRHQRELDRLYPSNSGLPGIPDHGELAEDEWSEALRTWKDADDDRWKGAEDRLQAVLLAGTVKAFDANGDQVSSEFWLANDLRSPRARRFRVRANDLHAIGLIPAGRDGPAAADVVAPPSSCGLPELMDEAKAAAFQAMLRLASAHKASRGSPPKRDAVAKEVSRETGYPVRKARTLYPLLPQDLRNPARKLRR